MDRERAEAYLRPAAAGRPAARSGTGMAAGRMHTPVPLGQTIPVHGAAARSDVCLLSYMRVSSGPQFSVFARTRDPSGRWEPSGPCLFDPFTARDDQGSSYQVSLRDIGSPVLGWTLMVRSSPRHDPRWLDLATGDGPAARIVLSSAAGQTRPPHAPDVMVSPSASSPGEQLLTTIAARLLAAVPPLPRIQLAILGLHHCEHSTIVHVHATGPACHTAYGPNEPYSWPPLWILDSGNRWHVTRTSGRSGQNGEMALRLEIVPTLSSKTAWIKVLAAGQSAQARARLPLRWQEL